MTQPSLLRQLGGLFAGRKRDPETVPPTAPVTWAERARDAYAAMVRHFAIPGEALFRERAPAAPTDRRYAYLWPFGQALAATLDVAALQGSDGAALARAQVLGEAFFAHYWDEGGDPPGGGAAYPLPTGGDKYFDDNLWIGLDLIALHRAAGERRWLTDAARVFAFVVAAWDDDPAHPAPGGLFWAQERANPSRDRNTVSNAPAAILALHLFMLTGAGEYLRWARRMFGWVEETLKDPDDALYWDHLKLNGVIEKTKWSYNQGTMLGAATLFHRADGDPDALARARIIAAGALDYYATDDRLWGQDPPFNAIFFRNLRLLGDELDDHQFYTPALMIYAERAWAESRDPRSGLVTFGRRGRVELLTQAAAVQIFATCAAIERA